MRPQLRTEIGRRNLSRRVSPGWRWCAGPGAYEPPPEGRLPARLPASWTSPRPSSCGRDDPVGTQSRCAGHQVTPALFARYPERPRLRRGRSRGARGVHRSTGSTGQGDLDHRPRQALLERYDGEVPNKLKDLVRCRSSAQTATSFSVTLFGVPGITVDTHFGRLVRRWKWTEETDPVKVEHAVGALIERKEWTDLSHA